MIDRFAGIPLLAAAGLARALTGGARGAGGAALAPGDSVLVVKQSALGDTLILLPVLKAVRDAAGPAGRVDMLVTPVNVEVARHCPWLDDVHIFDPQALFRDPAGVPGLLRAIRRRGYKVAVDFDQWLRSSALLTVLSGAERTAGFSTPGQHRHFAYDLPVRQQEGVHEAVLFERLAVAAGLPEGLVEPYAGFLARHGIFGRAPRSRAGRRPVVLLHPGCGSHGWQREWPVQRYALLGERLVRDAGASIELSGSGAHETELAARLAEAASFDPEDLTGRFSFAGLASHLASVDLVVSGNTGIMHLAAGLNVPLVAIHGPTDSSKWGPFYGRPADEAASTRMVEADTDCAPCLFLGHEYGCAGRDCMESISVDRVYEACAGLLGTPAGRSHRDP